MEKIKGRLTLADLLSADKKSSLIAGWYAVNSNISGIGAIFILDDSASSLNTVSREKKSASVRQADVPGDGPTDK